MGYSWAVVILVWGASAAASVSLKLFNMKSCYEAMLGIYTYFC